jgi:flagellar motor switch protein FliM
MRENQSITPYDITAGEKVSYGYYAALEGVFAKFINKLESFFYDEYKILFGFDFTIQTELKFGKYLKSLSKPIPLFIFGLSPLSNDCLLVADNRMVNLVLSRDTLYKEGRTAVDSSFSVDDSNFAQVKNCIEKVLSLFQSSWNSLYNVESQLKRLVSNTVKAKIMENSENCIRVRIGISQKRFKSYYEFCFSTSQLERVIEKHGRNALLGSRNFSPYDREIKQYFTDVVLKDSYYEVKGVLGSLNLSQKELIDSYRLKRIVPIHNEIEGNVVVKIGDQSVLSSIAGATNGHYSLQVNGKFEKKREEVKRTKKPFTKLRFSA